MNDPLRDSITDEALPPSTAAPPGTDRLDKFMGGLDRMEAGWDKLLTESGKLATSMRALRWALIVCIGLLLLVGIGMALHANSISNRVNAVTARLDEITGTLEQARASAQRTEEKVQNVATDVAEARAEAPTVEIRTSDAGAGSKPQAVVVVRPKAPTRPLLPAMPGADAGAPLPAIAIPVTLPKGSTVVPEDAGAP